MDRRDILRYFGAGSLAAGYGLMSGKAFAQEAPAPGELAAIKKSKYFINLGDFAKGDGTDETDAVQKAFDSIPPQDYKEHVTSDHPGGIIYIPRPPVAYCISKTINIWERFNVTIRCENPVAGSRGLPSNHYFRWIGPDGGVMFNFRSCHGMRVENLSMTGMDYVDLDRMVNTYSLKPLGRHTKGVTGIVIGPVGQQRGFQKFMLFENLVISNVDTGIKLGDFPNNGPDLVQFVFINSLIRQISNVGIWARSGNLANVTFLGLSVGPAAGANNCIRIDGGEMLVMNFVDSGREVKDASILVNAGGVHVIKAWSEFWAPFLRTAPRQPEWDQTTGGSVNYPIILEAVRHYDGGFLSELINNKKDPVPVSVVYNQPHPLHLVGCALWGAVELGSECMAPVIDYGTVFVNRDCPGFIGEGVTKHHRLIKLGTSHPKNARVVEPYFVDRRNIPGTELPKTGIWQKGDGIINIDPDPNVRAKACRGWMCVEAGEPGKWVPYGMSGR